MLSIIIPTYNESRNVAELIESIFAVLRKENITAELIIVDDGSPDGTGDIVTAMSKDYPVVLLQRGAKLGLASAVVDGFNRAKYDILCAMDADLSHPIEVLPMLFREIAEKNIDITVGSRLVDGGSSEDWTPHRRFASAFARSFAVPLTSVRDLTSGYFMLRRSVIDGVKLNPIGFKILLEILVKGKYKQASEVPIVFRDRKGGKSKMGLKQQLEYGIQLIDLYHVKYPTASEFVRFAVIGGSGVVVNLAVMAVFVEIFHLYYILASLIAFFAAVSNNFVLNKVITFPDKNGLKVHHQYINFVLVSAFGLLLNLGILYSLVEFAHLWYIYAQLIAIVMVGVVNFINSKYFVFK